ncbi:uncharacterized protein F4822DRAFT_430446 [Hypoxylon trugodes]|uniref:uncharacterized protein n=1 Tax=Hypoxylon trugodes TaxID=326681 RepID=UPI00219C9ADA|nr:uncharacterized protein F4822DRAFT_430446 [Hypoxylon trugodes]KAI1387699.1 hypothetical protein F4822DRAFT_430446 [Hypoxylon trugodes]
MPGINDLPVELVQKTMCEMDLKGLRHMSASSSAYRAIYMGAKSLILNRVLINELGLEIFQLAMLRYACANPDLKPAAGTVMVQAQTERLTPKMKLNGRVFIIDASRFQFPKTAFDDEVVREVMSFHEKVVARVDLGEAQKRQETARYSVGHNVLFNYLPAVKYRMATALYAAEILRKLCPREYGRDQSPAIMVKLKRHHWVSLIKTRALDIPFEVEAGTYSSD